MTLAQYKEERVITAAYGKAPRELVSEYMLVTKQMEAACLSDATLCSDNIMALDAKANALSREIMRYHL